MHVHSMLIVEYVLTYLNFVRFPQQYGIQNTSSRHDFGITLKRKERSLIQ